uniref:Protein TsetseEP domain-containing protein n=1 Tax=Stomoxys calcitrans TaxID=35570 RepID=A0A1I8PI88_STOCA
MLAVTLYFLLAIATQGALSRSALSEAENNLSAAILLRDQAMKENPAQASQCFEVYTKGINAANEKYETKLNGCLETATTETEKLEAEVADDRAQVTANGESVCSSYEECSQKESSSDFFECYVKAADASLAKSLDIQTVSKTKMQYVNLRYQTIEYDQKHCSDECSNAYVKESTRLYSELDRCLKTGVIVTSEPEDDEEVTEDYN